MKLSSLRFLPLLAALCLALPINTLAVRAQEAVKPSFNPATGTITDARWKSGVPLGGVGAAGRRTGDHLPPVRARYLRITNAGSVPGRFWSVHELTVYPAP